MTALSSFSPLQIIESGTLTKIQSEVAGTPSQGSKNLNQLGGKLEILRVESSILIDPSVRLKSGGTETRAEDIANVRLIHQAIKCLNTALATDERIWVTLAMENFHDYSIKRWHDNKPAATQEKYFKNHVLGSTSRARWRNQSISRLWWIGHYANRLGLDIEDKAIELFFFNTDLGSQLLGKPSISSSIPIARAIITVAHEALIDKETAAWNRDNFRSFMKKMDLLTGRRILETLPVTQLEDEVRELFFRTHDSEDTEI